MHTAVLPAPTHTRAKSTLRRLTGRVVAAGAALLTALALTVIAAPAAQAAVVLPINDATDLGDVIALVNTGESVEATMMADLSYEMTVALGAGQLRLNLGSHTLSVTGTLPGVPGDPGLVVGAQALLHVAGPGAFEVSGAEGREGAPGPAGSTGAPGADGEQGSNGSAGPSGMPGGNGGDGGNGGIGDNGSDGGAGGIGGNGGEGAVNSGTIVVTDGAAFTMNGGQGGAGGAGGVGGAGGTGGRGGEGGNGDFEPGMTFSPGRGGNGGDGGNGGSGGTGGIGGTGGLAYSGPGIFVAGDSGIAPSASGGSGGAAGAIGAGGAAGNFGGSGNGGFSIAADSDVIFGEPGDDGLRGAVGPAGEAGTAGQANATGFGDLIVMDAVNGAGPGSSGGDSMSLLCGATFGEYAQALERAGITFPEREGYAFLGWAASPEAGSPMPLDAPMCSDSSEWVSTYFALWKANESPTPTPIEKPKAPQLANTGSSMSPLLIGVGAVVVLGLGAVLMSRRRRTE